MNLIKQILQTAFYFTAVIISLGCGLVLLQRRLDATAPQSTKVFKQAKNLTVTSNPIGSMNSFWMKDEEGHRFYASFCHDYQVPFFRGVVIESMRYEARISCISLGADGTNFTTRRDSNGRQLLSQ